MSRALLRLLALKHPVSPPHTRLLNPQLSISGDGMLNEIMAGIWERPDRDAVLRQVIIAVFPAGTGNGLAMSLGLRAGPALAGEIARALQRSWCTPMDLQEAVINGRTHVAMLSTSWGFVAGASAAPLSQRI